MLKAPNRITKRLLLNVAKPTAKAVLANTYGNKSPNWYCTWKICCEVLKYTINDPVIKPETKVNATADLCFKNSFVPVIKIAGLNFIRLEISSVSGCLLQNHTTIAKPKSKLKLKMAT